MVVFSCYGSESNKEYEILYSVTMYKGQSKVKNWQCFDQMLKSSPNMNSVKRKWNQKIGRSRKPQKNKQKYRTWAHSTESLTKNEIITKDELRALANKTNFSYIDFLERANKKRYQITLTSGSEL